MYAGPKSGQQETEAVERRVDEFWIARNINRMMRHLMLLMVVIGCVATGILLTRDEPFGITNMLGALIACVAATGLYLQKIGYTRMVVASVVWSGWFLVSVWPYMVMGVRTPGLYAYSVFIMLAGWMLGRHSAMLMSLLSVINLMILYWGESAGWLKIGVVRTAQDYLVVMLCVLAMASLFAVYVAEGFRRQYRRQVGLAETLRRRVAELRRAESRAAQLFYQNPLPCMVTRVANGIICDVNQAWERHLGWSRQEALGGRAIDFDFWDSEEERTQRVAELPDESGMVTRIRKIRVRNGEQRVYLISSEIIEVDGEKRFLNSMLDQTEHLKAEEAIRELNATLESKVEERTAELKQTIAQLKTTQEELLHSEKLASLGSLVAGISHDLNTPIGNTLTVATTLQEHVHEMQTTITKGELKKSRLLDFLSVSEEMSDLLVRSCRRAAELVASFKQVAADQASERRRQFELKEVVEDVLVTLRPNFKHQPWRLECEVAPGIECDSYPGPLGQVVSNLIQNACLHAFEGRSEGTVTLRADRAIEGWVKMSVCDNGTGMEPGTLARVFDPFFTTRLGQGGSGLGLSVSYRIVTSILGGAISAESTPGQGTCFTVMFPVEAPHPL